MQRLLICKSETTREENTYPAIWPEGSTSLKLRENSLLRSSWKCLPDQGNVKQRVSISTIVAISPGLIVSMIKDIMIGF